MKLVLDPNRRKNNFVIDIHCHLLPRVDDGPRNDAEALCLAQEALKQGIHTIIATPHHALSPYYNAPSAIQEQVGLHQSLLDQHHMPLRLLPGQELRLTPDYIKQYEYGEWQTLANSRYLLVEWPARHIPSWFDAFLEFVRAQERSVVVAQPERNEDLLHHLAKARDWVLGSNVLFQLNAASLTGRWGKKVQHAAEELCRQRPVHFVASDEHHVHRRVFEWKQAYHLLQQQYGSSFVHEMQENALRLIHDEPITPSLTV